MDREWKPEIIALTEFPQARKARIDASFFPPVPAALIQEWEQLHGKKIPNEIHSFILQSDGLEAQRGEIWPVLPFSDWELIDDACASAHPWIQFAETADYRYLLSLGHSPSIYRVAKFGSDTEFFAAHFTRYLELIFHGEG